VVGLVTVDFGVGDKMVVGVGARVEVGVGAWASVGLGGIVDGELSGVGARVGLGGKTVAGAV